MRSFCSGGNMCAKLVVLGSINVDHVIQVPRFVKAGET